MKRIYDLILFSYNKASSSWVATNRDEPDFVAYTRFGGSMALGEHLWHVKFDSRVKHFIDLNLLLSL